MTKSLFQRVLLVAQESLDYIEKHPDGVTLQDYQDFTRKLLNRYGLVDCVVYWDRLVLDILETADSVKRIEEPGEPTRFVVKWEE
jgi:hypothetical protein